MIAEWHVKLAIPRLLYKNTSLKKNSGECDIARGDS